MALTRGGSPLGLELYTMNPPRFPTLLDIVNDKVAYKAKPGDGQLAKIKAVQTAIGEADVKIFDLAYRNDINGASDAVTALGRELAAIFPDATPQTTIIGTDIHRLRLMVTRAAGAFSPVGDVSDWRADAHQQLRLVLLDCLIAIFA